MLFGSNAYREHQQTKEYKDAVERSKAKSREKLRLSKEIWRMAYNVEQGNRIRQMLENGDLNDDDLDDQQQGLINRLTENEHELQDLRSQQLPAYRGAWAHVQG